jgi:hypothetical protein
MTQLMLLCRYGLERMFTMSSVAIAEEHHSRFSWPLICSASDAQVLNLGDNT